MGGGDATQAKSYLPHRLFFEPPREQMWSLIDHQTERVKVIARYSNSENKALWRVRRLSDGKDFIVYASNIRPDLGTIRPAHAIHRDNTHRYGAAIDARRTVQRVVLFGLIFVQIAVARAMPSCWIALAAASVGAFGHFGMQQMMHELSHRGMTRVDVMLSRVSDALFASCGPGFFTYYSQLHRVHHEKVGEAADPDQNFHNLWSFTHFRVDGFAKRWAWSVFIGLFTRPVVFFRSRGHGRAKKGPEGRTAGLKSLTAGLDSTALILCALWAFFFCILRVPGVLYIVSSAAFSMGAAGHPCLCYWIMQHNCSAFTDFQPTVSYRGRWYVHALFFAALRHAEHHDAPLVPFFDLWRVEDPKRCAVTSIRRLIWNWLRGRGEWMDVAGYRQTAHASIAVPLAHPRL